MAWDQTFDEEMSDWDAISPAWDQIADGEEGDESDWDAVVENGSSLFDVSTDAEKFGTYGWKITIDGNDTAYGALTDPVGETAMTIDWWLDPNSLTMADNDAFNIVTCAAEIFCQMTYSTALGFRSRVITLNDSAGYDSTSWYSINDAWNHIRIVWAQSSGSDDGYLYFYLDGVLQQALTGLDNDGVSIDEVYFGATGGIDDGTSGIFYMDDCAWSDGPGSPPFISTEAEYAGTYGMAVSVEETTARYGEFTDPSDDTICVLDCWLDPNTLTMAENDEYIFATGVEAGAGVDAVRLSLKYSSGYVVYASARADDDAYTASSEYSISDAYTHVRLVWFASTGDGNDDGFMLLYIDGVFKEAVTGEDNDTLNADTVRYGAVSGLDAGTSGVFFMDDCQWSDDIYLYANAASAVQAAVDPSLQWTTTPTSASAIGATTFLHYIFSTPLRARAPVTSLLAEAPITTLHAKAPDTTLISEK